MENLSLFARFLSIKPRSTAEILKQLQKVILSPLNCISLIYLESDLDENFRLIESSGLTSEQINEIHISYNLSEALPVANAIRMGKLVWKDNLLDSLQEFPLLNHYPRIFENVKTFIVLPVYKLEVPIGAIFINLGEELTKDEEIVNFLFAVSYIFSLSLTGKFESSTHDTQDVIPSQELISTTHSPTLSERDLVIIKLVSEGRTNPEISKILGYSVSTIRQEIMKIFNYFGLHHRSEVAKVIGKLFNS